MNYEVISIETARIMAEIEKENKELQDRIDKAVKYLLKNKLYKFKYDEEELFEITTDKKAKDDLLNILQGENNE